MMNILITESDDYSKEAISIYSNLGNVFLDTASNKDEINILVVKLNISLNYSYLQQYPNLEFIVTPTTGLTHIDLLFCEKRSIKIISLNDCKEDIEEISSTAELALGLMIALIRKITRANHDIVMNKVWNRNLYKSKQLRGSTIGIIGLGRIGSMMSNFCKALGMNVLAYDPYISDASFDNLGVTKTSLRYLLENSLIISMHANLTKKNYHMISVEQLSYMSPDTLIINTARGALIDESAVCKSIVSKRIGGIAVDVLENEHTDEELMNSELLSLAKRNYNVIVTPHIGGCTIDAMNITELAIAKTVKKILKESS